MSKGLKGFQLSKVKSWIVVLGILVYGFCMVVIPAILESDAENHAQEYNEYRLSIFPLLQEQDNLIMKWDKSNDKHSIEFVNDFQAIEDKMKAIQPEDERLRLMHAPLIVRSQLLTESLEKLHNAENPDNPEFFAKEVEPLLAKAKHQLDLFVSHKNSYMKAHNLVEEKEQ